MKLKKLLKEVNIETIKGPKDIDITGICSNSQCLAPGNLFVARKGLKHNGNEYIEDAIRAGAVAILTDTYDPFRSQVTQLIHPRASEIEGQLAACFYAYPSEELFLVGITGTNGKTTTSYLIKHLLDTKNESCGLIGSIEYIIGEHRYQATRTTPDVISNHKMLREMLVNGCKAAVMETTSHGLKQNRLQGIAFDLGIFTNLTRDHMDYHETFEDYAQSKARLFEMLGKKTKKFPQAAIVNQDDSYAKEMTKNCKVPILTYGLNSSAELFATDIVLRPTGTTFTVNFHGKSINMQWHLIGAFNVHNFLAALAVGIQRGWDIEESCHILRQFGQVPGRLERIKNTFGIHLFVDFSHTDDALKKTLESLSAVKTKRILTVFGCGGNRDKTKRPLMAKASAALSDLTIVTSDNPRNEDPQVICRDIIQGFVPGNNYIVEIDRKKAIALAIQQAQEGDILLIAGKGHETTQIFSHQTIEFDDRLVAAECCKEKERLHAQTVN